MLKEIEKQKYNVNVDFLLVDLINARLQYLKAVKSKRYFKESKHYLTILLEHFGNVKVIDVKKSEVHKLLINFSIKQKISGRDNYSVNAFIRAIKALFNYGIEYCDLEMVNPVKGIKMFPINKRIKYIPSDVEIKRLLSVCDSEQKRLVEFVKDTGARINEALNLTYADILENEVILYTRKSAASNRVPRKVPKPKCLYGLTGKPNDRVFERWSELPKFFYQKLSKLNLPLWGWHSLRHRFASLLSKQNKPLFEIMSLLGHSQIQTTQKYLQLLP